MKPNDPDTSPPSVPLLASFSAFLEDNDDDDLNEEAFDPPNVSVVGNKARQARVTRCARLGTLEWKDLKRKVPENLLEGPPGLETAQLRRCGMCWKMSAPVVRDGIDVVLLRQGDDFLVVWGGSTG